MQKIWVRTVDKNSIWMEEQLGIETDITPMNMVLVLMKKTRWIYTFDEMASLKKCTEVKT